LPPLASSARTVPLTFGFHGSRAPVVMSTAAAWLRVTAVPPPLGIMAVKSPPR